MHDVADRALVGHLALDPLRHQLERVLDVLLEVAVGGAARHRAHRAHAAIGLVGAALPQKHFARRLVGAGQQRADHGDVGAGGERLGKIAGIFDAAIGDHGHVGFLRGFDRIHDRGQLRHADAGDNPRGADRTGTDADLDRIGAGIDQRLRAFLGRDIAGDHLHGVGKPLDAVDGFQHPRGMAVRGVDHDQIDAGVDQPLGALVTALADGGRGRDPQPALRVLAGQGMRDRLFHVLHGDQSDAAVLIVDHQQFLDAVLVQHPLRLVLADAFAHRHQIFVRHQFGDFLARIGRKPHVAVGENADQLARHALGGAGDHRNAGKAVILHQRQRVRQHRVGTDGQRIDHHSGFELLDLPHLGGLAVDVEIAVNDADAAGLRHRDRHARFGDGIHRGGDDRNVERNGAGDVGADIGLRGQDIRQAGFQKHVVERKGFAYSLKSLRHYQLHSAARSPRYDLGMNRSFGDAVGITVESKPIGRVGGGR